MSQPRLYCGKHPAFFVINSDGECTTCEQHRLASDHAAKRSTWENHPDRDVLTFGFV